MLAVNFHLMGGMPIHAVEAMAPVAETPAPSSSMPQPAQLPQASAARSAPEHGPDAPAEVVLRRPIALQMLLTKVRENLV
jgi:hypothetical protein